MNTKTLVIVGVITAVISLAAVQAFVLPQDYAWGLQYRTQIAMMGGMNGDMSSGSACNMMNNQGMMGNMMSVQSMNAQQCQQHMASGGSQMTNGQDHQQLCQQQIGPNHNMTTEQCQAMH